MFVWRLKFWVLIAGDSNQDVFNIAKLDNGSVVIVKKCIPSWGRLAISGERILCTICCSLGQVLRLRSLYYLKRYEMIFKHRCDSFILHLDTETFVRLYLGRRCIARYSPLSSVRTIAERLPGEMISASIYSNSCQPGFVTLIMYGTHDCTRAINSVPSNFPVWNF